jgi:hypothetical protein
MNRMDNFEIKCEKDLPKLKNKYRERENQRNASFFFPIANKQTPNKRQKFPIRSIEKRFFPKLEESYGSSPLIFEMEFVVIVRLRLRNR